MTSRSIRCSADSLSAGSAEASSVLAEAGSNHAARRALIGALGASLLSACATRSPVPAGGAAVGVGERAEDDLADVPGALTDALARETAFLALSLVDTPYRYGGNTPEGGFDCSGLIVYVFREAARHPMPRTVAQIARAGQPVRYRTIRTGDIVLFDTAGPFTHAGIYVGSGRFVHAPSSGGVVRLDGVHARYWRPRFSGVRRV